MALWLQQGLSWEVAAQKPKGHSSSTSQLQERREHVTMSVDSVLPPFSQATREKGGVWGRESY